MIGQQEVGLWRLIGVKLLSPLRIETSTRRLVWQRQGQRHLVVMAQLRGCRRCWIVASKIVWNGFKRIIWSITIVRILRGFLKDSHPNATWVKYMFGYTLPLKCIDMYLFVSIICMMNSLFIVIVNKGYICTLFSFSISC